MSTQNFDAPQLKSFVERIENLEEEKKNLMTDIKEIFSEAKNCGYDVKIIKEVLKLRKMDKTEIDARDALVTAYLNALN